MKKAKIIFSFILAFTCTFSVLNAQESNLFALNRDINLKNSSEYKEVKINVESENGRFDLRIKTVIQSGKLKVEIYDQNKKKQGSFSIGCQLELIPINGNKPNEVQAIDEAANSSIMKTVFYPIPGEWIIKIYPENASGKLNISFIQEEKTGIPKSLKKN